MPRSGAKGTRARKRKPPKSIAISRPAPPADSPNLSGSTALLLPAEARVLRALHRYGITQDQWEEQPEISPIIWRTLGNQLAAMKTLRFSDDPEVKTLLKEYGKLTKDDQESLPLEIVCMAAKVSPTNILGQLIVAARDASRAETALVLMVENPHVLRAAATFGKALPNNVRDREFFLKATGTLPSPQGSSVNVNVFGKEPEMDYDDDAAIEGSTLPSDVFEYGAKTIDGWGDDRRKLLDADKSK
jgi:hypothetical protein